MIARLIAAREANRPVRAEVLNLGKAGPVFWMETSITPILDDGGPLQLWIAVEREIGETKEWEAELARARAAEAGQSKSRFLANMSHEIRTPKNRVIGVAELLSETRPTKLQREYVETILEPPGRLRLEIINDNLDLDKRQSGKVTREGSVTLRPPVPDVRENDVAHNGIARQFGGTGLTICLRLVEQMGGGISVRSEIGHGVSFRAARRDARGAGHCGRAGTAPLGRAAPGGGTDGQCLRREDKAAGLDGFRVKPLLRRDLLAEIEAYFPPDTALRHAMGL